MCARTFLVACLGVCTPFALGGEPVTGLQESLTVAAQIELPMELLASRPLVRVKINGQGPFAFLLDPQAPRTVIDARLVEALKLAPQKTGDGRLEQHADLEIGPTTIANVRIDVGDTSRLVPEFGPAAQPRGVLSLTVWAGRLVTLDYPRWRVTIAAGALSEPNEKDTFALGASPREFLVALSIGERTFRCHIDPLFPGGLLLPAADLAEFAPVETTRDDGSLTTRSGLVTVRQARLEADATFGSFVFKAPVVQFGGLGDAATLGGQWLADFSLTYDTTNGRVRLVQPRVSAR